MDSLCDSITSSVLNGISSPFFNTEAVTFIFPERVVERSKTGAVPHTTGRGFAITSSPPTIVASPSTSNFTK